MDGRIVDKLDKMGFHLHKMVGISYGEGFVNKLFHIVHRGEKGVFSTKKGEWGVDMNRSSKSFPQVINKLWKTYVNLQVVGIIVDK